MIKFSRTKYKLFARTVTEDDHMTIFFTCTNKKALQQRITEYCEEFPAEIFGTNFGDIKRDGFSRSWKIEGARWVR